MKTKLNFYDLRNYENCAVLKENFSLGSLIEKKINHITRNSIIIVCGYIGFGHCKDDVTAAMLNRLNEIAKSREQFIVFIRSNEDEVRFFGNSEFEYSNIILAQDYSILRTKIGNIICIGGSISYDRTWRVAKYEYILRKDKDRKLDVKCRYVGKEEKTVLREDILNEIEKEKIKIKFAVSIDCPSISIPRDTIFEDWKKVDCELENDLKEQYKVIDTIYNFLSDKCETVNWICSKYENENDGIANEKAEVIVINSLDDLYLSDIVKNVNKDSNLIDVFHF